MSPDTPLTGVAMDFPILHGELPVDIEMRMDNGTGRFRTPRADQFGYYDIPNYKSWTDCRETADTGLNGPYTRKTHSLPYRFNPQYYGVTAPEGCLNIARWFWYIEGHMGWSERTRIHRTECPWTIMAIISSSWFQNRASISLFSLMLRLGAYCLEDISMDTVLNRHSYAQNTKPAIYRFLDGYQHFVDSNFTGWRNVFNYKTKEAVKDMLIDRSVVEHRAYALWERAGRPSGKDREFWLLACNDISKGKVEDEGSYFAPLRTM